MIPMELIENRIDEILQALEDEVLRIVGDERIDKQMTNIHLKPLVSTKKILLNARDSIRMVDKLYKEDLEKLQ